MQLRSLAGGEGSNDVSFGPLLRDPKFGPKPVADLRPKSTRYIRSSAGSSVGSSIGSR